MNERHKRRSTTHGGFFFSVTRFYGKTLKNMERYVTDSRLGLAWRTLVVRCVKWGVRVAKQVRLIDSRVGDERQPSTRSHRSRRLRRSTDLLREITRHCTPRQRCIYPDYVTPLNRVYARPSSRFCSTLIEPRTNPSLSRFSFFFFEAEGKKQKDESILLSLYLESTFLLFFLFHSLSLSQNLFFL